MCLLGILGQSACPEVPYNVIRPLLDVCLACTCIGNNMGSLMGREAAMPAKASARPFSTWSLETDRARARSNPDRMTSYSASLLEAGNPSRIACSRCSPVGDCSKSPTPDPDDREAPSTRKVHHSFSPGSLRWIGLREYSSRSPACAKCCEGAGQLGQPSGRLGSRGGASGRHFEELRSLAPFFNTWFLRPPMFY
ncbi:hypothetical protein CK203_001728 [Vitis vinifera]|uniref:Uncharacterized protein n=1 Tax=Vitis vinifera TaxID=29760 RepID=A0A438KJN7_VITVI|nr:hypothetical protein CK203_001728 [Vitis vinifera]